MKQQTIMRDQQRREVSNEMQWILAVRGPLMGLAYIILLPLIGIFAIFMLCVEKVIQELNGNLDT